MDIVEKVARVLAREEAGNIGLDPQDISDTYEQDARAAIRATLEHYRDNVSEGMKNAPYAADIDFGPGGTGDIQAGPYNVFEAMINQALKELDRSEALDELGRLDGELM